MFLFCSFRCINMNFKCNSVSFFSRVWDKVVSGSCKILVFVAVEILLTFKIKVMALNSAEKITQFLENVSLLDSVWFQNWK